MDRFNPHSMEIYMSGQQPAFRILTKPEGAEKFSEIAAIWVTSKKDVFSVRLNVGGEEIKAIMVPNKPKTAEPAAPAAKKRSAAAHAAHA